MDRRSLRDLDILTLQLFVAICEEGTLTRAAKREAIAPSAVSKRLADLENAVKAELFYRGANGMTLTSAGETVLRYSRRMLENIESIGVELKEYARGVRGFVRLRANLGAIVQFLPDDLGTFLASNPEIMVDLGERSSRSVVDEVERGFADIGLCSSMIDTGRLERETLDYHHIGLQAHSSAFQLVSGYAEHVSVPLKLKLHVSSFDALLRMVQSGLGIGIMPDAAFEAIGRPMGLKGISLADDWVERQIDIVHRGEETLSAAGKLLLLHLSGSLRPRADACLHKAASIRPLISGFPDWKRIVGDEVIQ
jgi:DNA-binding transcriptional LysR family regulator